MALVKAKRVEVEEARLLQHLPSQLPERVGKALLLQRTDLGRWRGGLERLGREEGEGAPFRCAGRGVAFRVVDVHQRESRVHTGNLLVRRCFAGPAEVQGRYERLPSDGRLVVVDRIDLGADVVLHLGESEEWMISLYLISSIATDVMKDSELSSRVTANAEVSCRLTPYTKQILHPLLHKNTSKWRIFARHCETCTRNRTLLVLEDTNRRKMGLTLRGSGSCGRLGLGG